MKYLDINYDHDQTHSKAASLELFGLVTKHVKTEISHLKTSELLNIWFDSKSINPTG